MTAGLSRALRRLRASRRLGAERAPKTLLLRVSAARAERNLERELPDALRRVAAELGAGRTPDRALVAAAAAGGTPGAAFALAARRAAAGEEIATALASALGERARFAAAAISLQLRAGGDLPSLLRHSRIGSTSGAASTPRSAPLHRRGCLRVVPLLPVVGLALAALLDAGPCACY